MDYTNSGDEFDKVKINAAGDASKKEQDDSNGLYVSGAVYLIILNLISYILVAPFFNGMFIGPGYDIAKVFIPIYCRVTMYVFICITAIGNAINIISRNELNVYGLIFSISVYVTFIFGILAIKI